MSVIPMARHVGRAWIASGRGGARRVGVRVLTRLGIYSIATALAFLFLLPLIWMLSTALKPQALVYRFPPDLLSRTWTFEHFRQGWNAMPFGRFFVNTTIVTALSAFGTIISSSLVGFGFARYRARGANALFILLLATMMIPPTTTLLPRFVLFTRLGWYDTWLPLVVPTFFAAPFYVFLFRQMFRTIPQELFDAAQIDGCSPFGLYRRIAMPLAAPATAAAVIFSALSAWNDFTDPLVFLTSIDKFTIQLGLSSFQGQYSQQLHLMMPMALLALLPVLLLVLICQRWIAGVYGFGPFSRGQRDMDV